MFLSAKGLLPVENILYETDGIMNAKNTAITDIIKLILIICTPIWLFCSFRWDYIVNGLKNYLQISSFLQFCNKKSIYAAKVGKVAGKTANKSFFGQQNGHFLLLFGRK